MLYKFKTKNTGDIIMLQTHGQQVLEIIGKSTVRDPTPKGILLSTEMQGAIAALEAAIVQEEVQQKAALAQAQARGEAAPKFESIGLRHRAQPFMDMLRRCQQQGNDMVWGV